MATFVCDKCDKNFTRRESLDYHMKNKVCVGKTYNYDVCDEKNFACKFCNRRFTKATSMYRHTNHFCKIKKADTKNKEDILESLIKNQQETDKQLKQLKEANEILSKNFKKETVDLKKENKQLKQEVKTLKKNIKVVKNIDNSKNNNGIINNNINNHVHNNNIVLVTYGKEDMTRFDKKDILKVLHDGFFSSVSLTKSVHFNPKYPEYHNIFISNIKNRYAMMYVDGKWIMTLKEDLINKLYEDKKSFIEENFDEFMDSLPESRKRALHKWVDMDEEDQKVKEIKEQLKLLLYNSRNMVDDHITISSSLVNVNKKLIK